MSSSKKRPKHKPPLPSPSAQSTPRSSLKSMFLSEPSDGFFPSKDELFSLVTAVAIAVSVFFACNFFTNFLACTSHPNPFCESVVDSSDFLSDDYCQPCPSNARCYKGKLECLRGYRRHGNLCIEDGDINQTAKKLSEWAEFRLCECHAQHLCGGGGMIWVREDDIWSGLNEDVLMGHISSDSAMNNYTKQKAMEIVDKVLESKINSQGEKELMCPYALAESYKPFSCRAHQWISNNMLVILPIFVLIVGLVLLVRKVRRRLYLSERVDELYQQVCELLEESAVTSKGISSENGPWVVSSLLRDHLLSPKERKSPILWKKVEELVREDSRIDRYPKLVKGESKVVWEWQVTRFKLLLKHVYSFLLCSRRISELHEDKMQVELEANGCQELEFEPDSPEVQGRVAEERIDRRNRLFFSVKRLR